MSENFKQYSAYEEPKEIITTDNTQQAMSEKKTAEEILDSLFQELQRHAYNKEFHNYDYKNTNQIIRSHFENLIAEKYASQSLPVLTPEEEQAISRWVSFDFDKIETRPTKYGKYLICRKDGKIHWETWNGSGWAYNHNEIRYWAVIVTPINEANERRGK